MLKVSNLFVILCGVTFLSLVLCKIVVLQVLSQDLVRIAGLVASRSALAASVCLRLVNLVGSRDNRATRCVARLGTAAESRDGPAGQRQRGPWHRSYDRR